MKYILVIITTLVLTGCTKSATIEARTGVGGNDQPTIHCEVDVANPDYHPTESKKP